MNNNKIINPVLNLIPKSLTPIIVTGGSKIKSNASAALTVYVGTEIVVDYHIKLHDCNIIYQAKLIAIKLACE